MSEDPFCFLFQLIILSRFDRNSSQLHARKRAVMKAASGSHRISTFTINEPQNTHLEPLRHVCGADLIVLVSHVTTFELTWLVDLKNAFPPQPPLSLLLGSVPALFILILFLLLTLVICISIKVSKVKVATKNLLSFLERTVETQRELVTFYFMFSLIKYFTLIDT